MQPESPTKYRLTYMQEKKKGSSVVVGAEGAKAAQNVFCEGCEEQIRATTPEAGGTEKAG